MADVAGVGPLVRVRPLMDEEVVGLSEVAATEFADELLLGFGRQASPRGLLFWGQLGHIQEGTQPTGGGPGTLSPAKLGRIFLRGRQGQVGKIKARLGLERHGAAASSGDLRLGLDDVREPGEGGQLEARVHQAGHGAGHFGERGPRQMHRGVAQRPLVQVHGMQRTETIQIGQVVRGHCGQAIHCLKKGVVGELQRWVDGHRCWQGFAAHGRSCSMFSISICKEKKRGGERNRQVQGKCPPSEFQPSHTFSVPQSQSWEPKTPPMELTALTEKTGTLKIAGLLPNGLQQRHTT